MSLGCRPRVCCSTKQMPSGITICEMIEIQSGLRVSPEPCRPPVYTSATVMNRPDTLRKRSSRTPISATAGSSMPKTPSSTRGTARKSRPTSTATASPIREAARTASVARSGRFAPRLCPTTVAAAPISPTDVHVMSENSSV